MADRSFLDWPFFEDRHRALADQIDNWAEHTAGGLIDHDDVDGSCRALARALGDAGFCAHAVTAPHGGVSETHDVRSLCVIRETLARHHGLADFVFAMQGLGSGPIVLFGSDSIRQQYLPPVAAGTSLGAFALSEPKAGSDVASLATTAEAVDGGYVLNGMKTWISNGGIAGHYVVFARTGEAPGAKGLSAFVVPGDAPGLEIAERIDVIAPHPLAAVRLKDCHVSDDQLLGERGQGFKIAMATLDVFRSTVGAAALGFARRALDEALAYTARRNIAGEPLSSFQMVQAKIADMATAIDAAALLVYRAAWLKDQGVPRVSREAAMAKMFATEQAQTVIDDAV